MNQTLPSPQLQYTLRRYSRALEGKLSIYSTRLYIANYVACTPQQVKGQTRGLSIHYVKLPSMFSRTGSVLVSTDTAHRPTPQKLGKHHYFDDHQVEWRLRGANLRWQGSTFTYAPTPPTKLLL